MNPPAPPGDPGELAAARQTGTPLGERSAAGAKERRYTGIERRKRPTPMLSRYTFRGRRRELRRSPDGRRGYYVDRYSPIEIAGVVVLLALTLVDALATLHILDKGGTELNPIMRSALEVGNEYFLVCKLTVSLAGAVLILLHSRFPGVRWALQTLLALYAAVVVYHAFLLFRAIP